MKRKIALSVACLIDEDIHENVGKSRAPGNRRRSDYLRNNDRVRIKYAASVVRVLSQLYDQVDIVPAVDRSTRTIDALLEVQPDVVFNLAFSTLPAEAALVGCLDLLRIPYTGSGALGIALAGNKALSRHVLRSIGLPVPHFVELPPGRSVAVDISPPLIVKPVSLSSSVGLHKRSVVTTAKNVASLASEIWNRYGVPAICEEFIVGREFRVALVETRGGVRVAGATEWHFGAAERGWGFRTEAQRSSAKKGRNLKVSRTVVSPSDPRCAEFAAIGHAAMTALSVRGYAIIDLRVDAQDRTILLEVNPNPGIWADGASWSHPNFETTIKDIVAAALRT